MSTSVSKDYVDKYDMRFDKIDITHKKQISFVWSLTLMTDGVASCVGTF